MPTGRPFGTRWLTWQSSQYWPPISSAEATTAAHTEVVFPEESSSTGMDLCLELHAADLSGRFFSTAWILIRTHFGLNTTWVHSDRTYATVSMTFVERNGKQDVRGFGSAVSKHRVIRRAFKVGIVQVHIRVTMPRKTN